MISGSPSTFELPLAPLSSFIKSNGEMLALLAAPFANKLPEQSQRWTEIEQNGYRWQSHLWSIGSIG